MINRLTDRNSQFRKLGVVIKNFFSRTCNKNTYLRLQPCYLYLISKLRCFRVFNKRLRALNWEDVRFSGGSCSPENFWYEVTAVSSSLVLSKAISSSQNFSLFLSWNNNSKGSKNSEYSINPGLTEKLRTLHKTFFS